MIGTIAGAVLMSAGLAAAPAAAVPSLAAMTWHDRVLLVAAPDDRDAAFVEQRRILAAWRAGAADRDLRLVTLVGRTVIGAADASSSLARAYRLPANRFVAILIGKDGGEKLRSPTPITADTLRETIDAMPMRRNGER